MQDCKECVHNEVCTEFSKTGLFPNCKASSLIQKRVTDKGCDCEHFRKEIYGKWLETDCKCFDCFVCNKCGKISHQKITGWDSGKIKIVFSKFCPNCGTRMDSE